MGQIFCNPGDQGTTLPDSSGLGGTASAVFKYGWYAGDASNSPTQTPAGTCVLYAGTCVIPVGIGLMETTKTYTDGAGRVWDWTCLPATATGTAHVWAMISAP
jgi:hypothetical protein